MASSGTRFTDAKDTPPPKDGNLLLLVMKADDTDSCHPTENDETFITIGFNAGNDNGEDKWFCAGWNWCADEFVSTSGEILAWMELPEKPNYLTQQEEGDR